MHHRRHNGRISGGSIAAIHVSVKVGNRPRFGGRFIQMAWDEMEMNVLGSLTKGNGIHALASADLFHKITGIANSEPQSEASDAVKSTGPEQCLREAKRSQPGRGAGSG